MVRLRPLRFLIAGMLAVSLCATAARATETTIAPDPQNAVMQARERVAAGDMTGAISYLQTYIEGHEQDIAARRFLGDLYFRVGQVDRAAVVYEHVLRDAPFDKETHNRLGTVYAEENRVDDAIRQFDAALPGTDSVSDLVELHARKGDLGAYEAKVEAFAQAMPGDAGAQAEEGQLLNALHQQARAVPYFLRALDSSSDDLTALNGLGLAYLDLHQYDQAIATFHRCLRVDPLLYQCTNNIGATQLELREYDQARASLDKAFRLEPERGETFVNFGYLADEQGDWQKASAEYGKAIERYPYLREAYIDLALDYERHGLNVLAQAVLIKGIASVHDDGRLHVLLGQAYEAQGNRIDALSQFRMGIKGSDPTAASVASRRLSELDPSATEQPQ
jgi:tetratricopeptide (TPR) repeat protein